jgi:thiol-disulfide isomerase/thioredoxin
MKKLLATLLVLVAAILFVGCSKKSTIPEKNVDDIFTGEGKYFVFFYRDDCTDCENTKPVIISYNKFIQENSKYANKKTVYAVNLSKPENSSVYRAYTQSVLNWGKGQGDEGDFWVDGVTSRDKLYISATAALVSVGVNNQNERFTTFIASGYDDISQYLNNYLQ